MPSATPTPMPIAMAIARRLMDVRLRDLEAGFDAPELLRGGLISGGLISVGLISGGLISGGKGGLSFKSK